MNERKKGEREGAVSLKVGEGRREERNGERKDKRRVQQGEKERGDRAVESFTLCH